MAKTKKILKIKTSITPNPKPKSRKKKAPKPLKPEFKDLPSLASKAKVLKMLRDRLPLPKIKKVVKEKTTSKRSYSNMEQLMIVYLRFGSLESFDQVCKSFSWIGQNMHIHPNSANLIVRRFLASGYKVVDRRKERTSNTGITPEIA